MHPFSTCPPLSGNTSNCRNQHSWLEGLPVGQGLGPPLNGVPAQHGNDRVHLPLDWEDKEDGLVARVVQLYQLAGEHRVVQVLDGARLEHHGHLHRGRLIHVEVIFPGAFRVEGVCPRAWEEGGGGGEETDL